MSYKLKLEKFFQLLMVIIIILSVNVRAECANPAWSSNRQKAFNSRTNGFAFVEDYILRQVSGAYIWNWAFSQETERRGFSGSFNHILK